MENSFLQIVVGCAKQDPGYQKIFYEEYYGILLKVAFRYVSTYEQALELTQKGFLKIFRELIRHRFDHFATTRETLTARIKRTFIISVVKHIRSEFNLHRPGKVSEDIWNQYDRPLTDLELLYIKLIKILKGLPTIRRLVFNLYVIDGFTHVEIAGMLGITVGESKKNLVKAREYCNQILVRNSGRCFIK